MEEPCGWRVPQLLSTAAGREAEISIVKIQEIAGIHKPHSLKDFMTNQHAARRPVVNLMWDVKLTDVPATDPIMESCGARTAKPATSVPENFIGSHLARHLLQKQCEVSILDNFSPQVHGKVGGLPPDLDRNVTLHKCQEFLQR